MRSLCALAAWLLITFLGGAAQATPILKLSANAPRISPGQSLLVDVSLTGLDKSSADFPLGAFSFDLHYDPALDLLLSGQSSPGPGLGLASAGQALYDFSDHGGLLSIDGISLLDAAMLASLQDSSFRLATLAFYMPLDFLPGSASEVFLADHILLANAAGDAIAVAPDARLAVPLPVPGVLPLLSIGMGMLLWASRCRRALAGGALLAAAAASAQVTPPLPDGPLPVTISSTSLVAQPFTITAGAMSGYNDSLVPMGVNETKEFSYAQFQIVSPVNVKITFSSDDGSNFDRFFDFTPGIYFVGMQYTSPFFSSDYADLWIQKYDGTVFGPKLLQVRKAADSYVHAFFRTSSSGASGIEQVRTSERTVTVSKTLTIPAGQASFSNSDGLWPTGLLCSSPSRCSPMSRTISAGGVSLTLKVANGADSASGAMSPSRYDRIDAVSSGQQLQLVHTRLPFVPPGAPTIDQLPAQAPITAAYGVRTLTLSGIGDGSAGENQGLSLSATSSNPTIIPAPELLYHQGDSTALLRYHAAPGAEGKAILTVRVTDDGGTPGYPADDQSTSMSFAVTVLARRACEAPPCPVYIGQRDNDLVDVIDAGTNTVSDQDLRGGAPWALALSPDGKLLYSVVRDNLLINDTATHQNVATLTLPGVPSAMAQSPAGDRLYLAIPALRSGSTDTLAVLDTDSRTLSQFDLGTSGYADQLISSLDGRRLYVSTDDGALLSVATPTLSVLGTVPIDSGPHHLAISPEGDKVYVVSRDHNSLAVIDSRQNTELNRITTGAGPAGIALTPDGKLALLAVRVAAFQGRIDTLDTATLSVTRSTSLKGLNGPQEIALTPDGTRAYVTLETDRSAVVLSTLTGRITQTIPVGVPTMGLAIAPLPLLPLTIGDVNHDEHIDQRDMDRVRADLNRPVNAAACGLACDLDADGVITVLDGRRLVNLCQASSCRIQ